MDVAAPSHRMAQTARAYQMSGIPIKRVLGFLEDAAPSFLAEEWDNVGLLVGDRRMQVERVMTCLTLTTDVADEAAAQGADLIVTHHPLPFRPLTRITSDTATGQILMKLIRAGIAVFSSHTAYDSAANGINQRIAEGLELESIRPIRVVGDTVSFGQPGDSGSSSAVGSGRIGRFSDPVLEDQLIEQLKTFFSIDGLHVVGACDRSVTQMAIACGSAGSFLDDAIAEGCDAFLTGESNFHTCLQARTEGILMLLPGHFATERFAMEWMSDRLQKEFRALKCWASRSETDPLIWF